MRSLKLTDEVKSIYLARATWIRCSTEEKIKKQSNIAMGIRMYMFEYNSVDLCCKALRIVFFLTCKNSNKILQYNTTKYRYSFFL